MTSKEPSSSSGPTNSQNAEVVQILRTREDFKRLFGNRLKRKSDQDLILSLPPENRMDWALRLLRGEKLFDARGEGIKKVAEQRQRAAIEDPLTKLYNRKGFDKFMKKEIAEAERYKKTFCILMLDIDYFKSVNDAHGHPVGDLVLKEFSRALSEILRESDVLCRLGGEEFVAILPETDLVGARVISEKLRKKIGRQEVRIAEENIKITISIGVAEFQPGQKKKELVEAADMALYEAKNNGRDRVEVFLS